LLPTQPSDLFDKLVRSRKQTQAPENRSRFDLTTDAAKMRDNHQRNC